MIVFEAILYSLVAIICLGVPSYAWRTRGRTYAIFGGVILCLSMPGTLLAAARFEALFSPEWLPLFHALVLYCVATAGIHLALLVRARMRSRAFRMLVSVPGQATVAAGFMLGVWLLAMFPVRLLFGWLGFDAGLAVLSWFDLVPILVAVVSIGTSARPVAEVVRVRLGGLAAGEAAAGPSEVSRVPVERFRGRTPAPLATRPLRIVQIADPHLGPWQSVRSLHRIVSSLLEREPDLILLTGDFLTMESMGTPGALCEALAPLRDRPGDCFAIYGNHDHEAADEVAGALEELGVRLLVDEEAIAQTPIGPVQLVGADYVRHNVRRKRGKHLADLLARYPRIEGHLRLMMLHDPLGFRDIVPGEIDLVLSGHTHGGQVGLVSLGLDWTVLSRSAWPDHGLFALGSNRLYVHRGTGFYGFPLRVGVPGEASMLELILD